MEAPERTAMGPSEQRRSELLRSYRESGEVLVHTLSSRLRRHARRRGLDLEAAREVVQQAFADLFSRRPRLENIEAWLVRVVDRRSIDWIRRTKVSRRVASDLPLPAALAGLAPDERIAIDQALRGLPERQQQLVRLRYFEGCDEATAAARTGYSPKSVKKLLTRALARLRETLGSAAANRSGSTS